jgi:hypothetical protein
MSVHFMTVTLAGRVTSLCINGIRVELSSEVFPSTIDYGLQIPQKNKKVSFSDRLSRSKDNSEEFPY